MELCDTMEQITLLHENELYKITVSQQDARKAENDSEYATRLINVAKINQQSDDGDVDSESMVYRWSDTGVKLLLHTYQEHKEAMVNGEQSQKIVWERIASALMENGHIVTGAMCAAKLRSLKKTYKKIKSHNDKSCNNKRYWEHFDLMDEIFSKTTWCDSTECASEAQEKKKIIAKKQSFTPKKETATKRSNRHEDSDNMVYRWNDNCVKNLLLTYKDNRAQLFSGKQSHKQIWDHIGATLMEMGHNVSGPMCAAKLRSLKKTYKRIKSNSDQSSNEKRNWEHFNLMDEIFSNPVTVAIFPSEPQGRKRVGSENCSTSEKETVTSLLAKRLKQNEEHELARVKRHEETLALGKRLIEVLEKLANKQ